MPTNDLITHFCSTISAIASVGFSENLWTVQSIAVLIRGFRYCPCIGEDVCQFRAAISELTGSE